jgi:hypothetical protein
VRRIGNYLVTMLLGFIVLSGLTYGVILPLAYLILLPPIDLIIPGPTLMRAIHWPAWVPAAVIALLIIGGATSDILAKCRRGGEA